MRLEKYIDHTLLKPDATREQIIQLCKEARKYGFASVCVNSVWIAMVAGELNGSDVSPCVVISFPLGAATPQIKAAEAAQVVKLGAKEVDMVINIGAVKDADWELVEEDIKAVVEAIDGQAKLKVIIETCLLTDEEKVHVCKIAKSVGADYVKTSTGFSTGGATIEDVRLMRDAVGNDMGVKASGGIRSKEEGLNMIRAGANRLGTSSGCKIMETV